MPAHRDQDLPTSQPAYYMRSAVSANSENDGCCLFLNSETDGGDVAEVSTDPCDHTQAVICNFRPGQQLHWTDSREPPSGQMDSDFVRIIPFDNVWLGGMLNGGVMRGLRLAPLYPRVRHPIACCRCGAICGDPAGDASFWLGHFGHALQVAAGHSGYTCLDCCV